MHDNKSAQKEVGGGPLGVPNAIDEVEVGSRPMGETEQSTRVAASGDLADARYVKLDPEFAATITWTNDPRHLDLHGAFSKDEPSLSSDFNVQDLRPIVKEDGGNMWVLQNAVGLYYLWDLWTGRLLKVTDYWSKGPELQKVEDVVLNIVRNLTWVEEDAVKVYRTYD